MQTLWLNRQDAFNGIAIASTIVIAVLAGQKKYAEATIIACVVVMINLNLDTLSAYLPSGADDAAPTVVDVDGTANDPPPVTKLPDTVKVNFSAARNYDDAAHESIIRAEEPAFVLNTDTTALAVDDKDSDLLHGQSKTIFENKFTRLPHQIHKPVISTRFDDVDTKSIAAKEQQPPAQNLQELLARQSFYNSIASGGDMLPRVAPGIHTMLYLASSKV